MMWGSDTFAGDERALRLGRSLAPFAAILLGLGAVPALATQNPVVPRISFIAPVTHEDDLRVLANMFLPAAPLKAMILASCDTPYRSQLAKRPADVEIEQQLPGIHDAMVAAAVARCRLVMDGFMAERQAKIRADWSVGIAAHDLHRLAVMLAPATQEAADIPIVSKPGDTATAIAQRMPDATEDQERRFTAAQAAFARTPGGPAMLNRVSAYQRRIDGELAAAIPQVVTRMIPEALADAHRVANAYGRAHGLTADLYPSR
jgi:hypothetical protein